MKNYICVKADENNKYIVGNIYKLRGKSGIDIEESLRIGEEEENVEKFPIFQRVSTTTL